MKIFLCASKHVYDKILPIKEQLEGMGHSITPPNSFEAPMKEEEMKKLSKEEHLKWKQHMMFVEDHNKIKANDAILILNMEKHGQPNYIGGATFLEAIKAFELGKKVFLYNPIPENTFKDELTAIDPIILNGDLSKVR